MRSALDTLSAIGSELTDEQLGEAAGGALPILVILMATNTALKGTFIYLAISG